MVVNKQIETEWIVKKEVRQASVEADAEWCLWAGQMNLFGHFVTSDRVESEAILVKRVPDVFKVACVA